MYDDELIDMIAKIWVSNGGDAEGMIHLYTKLVDRIKELEEE